MAKKTTTIDTMVLRPSDITLAIKHMVKVASRSTFIWGPPGIGKSQLIAQLAAELGMDFVDIRLSQMDPTDLRGIPYPTEDKETGRKGVRWQEPMILPSDPESTGILLLDEFNSAPPTVQAAAYQLVLDKKLGEYEVPKGWIIVAAGNRETDKGVTFRMATPVANRFIHLEMEANFEDWQTHALSKRYNEYVVGYLSAFEPELFLFQANSASRGFATPRSWQAASEILDANPDLPKQVLLALIAGAVGDGTAIKFMAYRANAAELPKAIDILTGRITTMAKTDISLKYALTTSLCYKLNDENREVERLDTQKDPSATKRRAEWLVMSDYFCRFMLENFEPELCIMGMRTALQNFRLPFQIKVEGKSAFQEFTAKYKKYLS